MSQISDGAVLGTVCPVSVIPVARRQAVYEKLFHSGKRVSVAVDVDDDLALLGVSAVDWAGLASVVIGELHHLGWNLDLVEGFATIRNGVRHGVIITGIVLHDSGKRGEKFEEDAQKLSVLLQNLAVGRAGVVSLLNRSADRIECYQGILEELKRLYKGNIPEGILGESGQLVLFISSRSDQYLRARKFADLAWIVKTNHDLVEKVRVSGGMPYYRIRNIRAAGEHLTGINIVGYERDISFQKLIATLSAAWPNSVVSHQRKYTTSDGIVSIRVEMTGANGMSATRTELRVIREYLRKLLVSRGIEKLNLLHHYGGTEHIARALLPLLIQECRTTGINQAYITMENLTTFTAELKLLLVTSADREDDLKEHDSRILGMVKYLGKRRGMGVKSFKSPSRRKDVWVDVFDFLVERESFDTLEDAYTTIKYAIEEGFGEFRDFDQGMRLHDVYQLEKIRKMLSDIPDTVVTDFYYSLEEFMRASVPVEELAQHIRLLFETISGILSSKAPKTKIASEEVSGRHRPVATLLCCAVKGDFSDIEGMFSVVRNYRVTASIIRWSGAVAVLFRVQKNRRALPEDEKRTVLDALSKRIKTGD